MNPAAAGLNSPGGREKVERGLWRTDPVTPKRTHAAEPGDAPGGPPAGPRPLDCDVIVVGSGAGGATFAYACAQAGKSVLLLEQGRKLPAGPPVHDLLTPDAAALTSGSRPSREHERRG